ncbi:MAG: Hpt domain-containing protein [Thermodesulfobacteriota bacterium]|nr:Hpt domain-containing protein [Thermodesulfobacteriota bacterium]
MNIAKLANDQGLTCDEFIEIIVVFIDTAKRDIEAIRSAVANDDAEAVVLAAHSLKGAAGNLGLDEFYDIALGTEQHARKHELTNLPRCVDRLEEALRRLVSMMRDTH